MTLYNKDETKVKGKGLRQYMSCAINFFHIPQRAHMPSTHQLQLKHNSQILLGHWKFHQWTYQLVCIHITNTTSRKARPFKCPQPWPQSPDITTNTGVLYFTLHQYMIFCIYNISNLIPFTQFMVVLTHYTTAQASLLILLNISFAIHGIILRLPFKEHNPIIKCGTPVLHTSQPIWLIRTYF